MTDSFSNQQPGRISTHIALNLRQLYTGGNWTSVNVQEQLSDISLDEALTKIGNFNTIAILLNHTSYYIKAVLRVMKGQPLNAKDELSFDHPPLLSEDDWKNMKEETFTLVEELAGFIEKIPDDQLAIDFSNSKYGTWFRNLIGLSEHTHYHLGQIVLLKKLIRTSK